MAEYDGLSPGQVLADASVAEFIKNLGLGIAEAQQALDENSINQIAEFIEPREGLAGRTLLDLGLSPAFYHYQYADLSCSLQLSLKIEKNLSLALNLNGSYSDTTTSSNNNTQASSSSESGSSSSTQTRTANVSITSSSAGALTIGGSNFSLTGSSPLERIRNLRNAVTSDSNTGVDRILHLFEPTPLTITETPESPEIVTTANTVAFIAGGFDSGIVRVGSNTDTDYILDTGDGKTASTTAKASLAAYAEHVRTQIVAQGYTSLLYAPGDPITTFLFDTGDQDIRSSYNSSFVNLAQAIKTLNEPVALQGFADRQQYSSGGEQRNIDLGNRRANEVKQRLISNGVPAGLITITPSEGDQAAEDAGDAINVDNQAFRKVEVKTPSRTEYWVFVFSPSGSINLDGISPDMRGNTSSDNGFIFLFKPTALALTGTVIGVDGNDFPLRNVASGSAVADSPEAYAKNLADDINGNSGAGLAASATGNVVTISRNGDQYQLTLYSSTERNITMSGTSGVTVTTQFSRSSSSNLTQQNTGNRTVAVGASLDVGYSRKFEMNVTGNSSISARLVSIPAPPQFLETIRTFLDGNNPSTS